MKQDVLALLEKREELSSYAQVIRSQNQLYPDEMMGLAKILSRKALLDMHLATLGISLTHEIPTINDDECPF